jgi:hypothetical protein
MRIRHPGICLFEELKRCFKIGSISVPVNVTFAPPLSFAESLLNMSKAGIESLLCEYVKLPYDKYNSVMADMINILLYRPLGIKIEIIEND